jgi:hypothetical protein
MLYTLCPLPCASCPLPYAFTAYTQYAFYDFSISQKGNWSVLCTSNLCKTSRATGLPLLQRGRFAGCVVWDTNAKVRTLCKFISFKGLCMSGVRTLG